MTSEDSAPAEVGLVDFTIEVAVLLYDHAPALDAIGPYKVPRGMFVSTVKFVAETPELITVDSGPLLLLANYSLDEVSNLNVVLIPAVKATAMGDERVMSWIRSAHQTSRWTTADAGALCSSGRRLLDGLRAKGHWSMQEAIEGFGATYSPYERYVRQGKIITAAGISAGIDMVLYLAGEIAGAEEAQIIQLMMEYDPKPPFDAGSLAKASREVVEMARVRVRKLVAESSSDAGRQP